MAKNPFIRPEDTSFTSPRDLDHDEAEQQVTQLREAIRYHNRKYYSENDPDIADSVYDALFRRLQDLEEAFPDLDSQTSPTKRVGAPPVEQLTSVNHVAPLLSLDSAVEAARIRRFYEGLAKHADEPAVSLEPKLDGFSVELVYRDGALVRGVTRGDGYTGEDITHNLRRIPAVPLELERSVGSLSVRGEVIMIKSGFQQLNRSRIERGAEPFANPRNAAAGMMRQLDPSKVASDVLDFLAYEILQSSEELRLHRHVLENLGDLGFRVIPEAEFGASFEAIESYRNKIGEAREDLDYEIDGIVIKADDHQIRDRMGRRERNPRWAMAWKFPPRQEVTTLRDIAVQVGRTGILTPVALLDPVEIGGVTVSRATLHTIDEVHDKDLRIGDHVRVQRAGDVIPEVVESLSKDRADRADPFEMPEQCPVCQTEVIREGAYVYCPAGLSCDAQLRGRLTHFASRQALDIRGLGDKVVEQLIDRGLVHNFADLFRLEPEDIEELEGFAKKSAKKLHAAIQDSKAPPFDRFLYGLGIPHVGSHVARILAATFADVAALESADREELKDVAEIGPETADMVAAFFEETENREIIEQLFSLGVRPVKVESEGGGQLADTTFVFTGDLEGYTRKEAQTEVERRGGRSTSSVSGNTDYVVVGENPGKKLDQAREHGVTILDEQEFIELLNRSSG